ncbi:MAG: hypothetical protein OXE82_01515 [Rhodobacter sp.]|nr:hypothetical protein [Rhodobacter sp.]
MDGFEDLERRMGHAFDRIGTALHAVRSGADVSAVRETLAAARKTNAELESLMESRGGAIESLEARIKDLESRNHDLTVSERAAREELERLKESVGSPPDRAAGGDVVEEPDRSREAELDKLHSMREADRAELDGIIGELRKLELDGVIGDIRKLLEAKPNA